MTACVCVHMCVRVRVFVPSLPPAQENPQKPLHTSLSSAFALAFLSPCVTLHLWPNLRCYLFIFYPVQGCERSQRCRYEHYAPHYRH